MSEGVVVRASDVMKDNFVMIDGKQTVAEALRMIEGTGIQTFIVAKRDEGDEFGLVLLSDIAKKVLACDRAPERVNIYEIMSKPVLGVSGTMDVRYCARLFQRFGVHQAPVIEDGVIKGMVSYNDMVLRCFRS